MNALHVHKDNADVCKSGFDALMNMAVYSKQQTNKEKKQSKAKNK